MERVQRAQLHRVFWTRTLDDVRHQLDQRNTLNEGMRDLPSRCGDPLIVQPSLDFVVEQPAGDE